MSEEPPVLFTSDQERQAWLVQVALRHRAALLPVALAVLRHVDDAEDALQEAFITAMAKLSEVDGPEGGLAWLRRIIHLKALERRRNLRHSAGVGPEPLALLAGEAMVSGQEDETAAAEAVARRKRVMTACLAGLDGESRRILEDYYWKNHSVRDIAQALGKTEEAVRMAMSRIRKRLREQVSWRLAEEDFPCGMG